MKISIIESLNALPPLSKTTIPINKPCSEISIDAGYDGSILENVINDLVQKYSEDDN